MAEERKATEAESDNELEGMELPPPVCSGIEHVSSTSIRFEVERAAKGEMRFEFCEKTTMSMVWSAGFSPVSPSTPRPDDDPDEPPTDKDGKRMVYITVPKLTPGSTYTLRYTVVLKSESVTSDESDPVTTLTEEADEATMHLREARIEARKLAEQLRKTSKTLEELQANHPTEVSSLKAAHAEELRKLKAAHTEEVTKLTDDHAAEVATLKDARNTDVSALKAEVDTKEGEMEQVRNILPKLEAKRAAQAEQIETLTGDKKDLEDTVAALTSRLEAMERDLGETRQKLEAAYTDVANLEQDMRDISTTVDGVGLDGMKPAEAPAPAPDAPAE